MKPAKLPPGLPHQRLLVEGRRRLILERLNKEETVTVEELAKLFSVSAVTVRSDLDALNEAGLLIRSHGGAVKGPVNQHEVQLGVKETLRRTEKSRIAERAATFIKNDETIILDSGTTTLEIARRLKDLPLKSLTVITNALNIAVEVARLPHIRLIMLGGILRHSSQSLVGRHAEEAMKGLNADRAFIGVDGLDLTVGLSTPDLVEAELNALMIRAARETFIVADSSKFGRRSLSVIAQLERGFTIVTDAGVSASDVRALAKREIQVVVV